jgi:hypothetical protein
MSRFGKLKWSSWSLQDIVRTVAVTAQCRVGMPASCSVGPLFEFRPAYLQSWVIFCPLSDTHLITTSIETIQFWRVLTLVYCTWTNHVFGLCPWSNVGLSKNKTFRKLDLFPSSGKIMAAPTLLGLLERPNLNHWASSVRSQTCNTWAQVLLTGGNRKLYNKN